MQKTSNPNSLRPHHRKALHGQIMVVMACAVVALIGAMALGIDVAMMYVTQLRLQNTVDAAALAGSTYVNGGIAFKSAALGCSSQPDDASKAACTYVANNGLAVDSTSLKIYEPGQNLPASAPTPNIQVWAQRPVSAYFGSIIGLKPYKVSSIAAAQANGPIYTVSTGLFPMAVQCTNPCSLASLNPGSAVPFGVKFSPTGAASGNWQWLSLGGTGASVLGANVQNGASGSYSVGDSISTEPGNKGNAGPVKGGFSSRMASCASVADPCSGANPNDIPPGDPCLITVPAVDFTGCHGRCSMNIEAFAEVYIEPSSSSTNINACFVKAVTAHTVTGGSPQPPNLGATTPPSLIQ